MAQNQYQYLAHRDPDIDFLLASSRRALVFVEENEVNTAVKPFLSLSRQEIQRKSHRDAAAFTTTLNYAFTILSRYAFTEDAEYVS